MTGTQFRVDLHDVHDLPAFASAFNEGLISAAGGHWNGVGWDAFNDYLSWPAEDSYALLLDGWSTCDALNDDDRAIFEEILADNAHVLVTRT